MEQKTLDNQNKLANPQISFVGGKFKVISMLSLSTEILSSDKKIFIPINYLDVLDHL